MNINPLVTVIVPHHLSANEPYLKLCIDSILTSHFDSFEVICVSDASDYYDWMIHYDSRLTYSWEKTLSTASAKINWAATQAKGRYIWIVSDDVMVSPHAMRTLVEGMSDNAIICNPLSNSDNGSQFHTDLGIPVKLSREDLDQYCQIISVRGEYQKPFLIPVKAFISFYCTMIPKKVWDLVGDLDERMDVRHNDVDWCIRALKLGIQPMINLGAFALHFGDKTLPKCTSPQQYSDADRAFNEKYF